MEANLEDDELTDVGDILGGEESLPVLISQIAEKGCWFAVSVYGFHKSKDAEIVSAMRYYYFIF